MMEKEQNEKTKVKIHKRENMLKKRAAAVLHTNEAGRLDPKYIEEAEKLIDDMCEDCGEEIGKNLEELSVCWTEMQTKSDDREKRTEQIFTLAHEIKDIAQLCKRDLVAYFAESLRDYIAETTLSVEGQRIIIQAHIDAITAAYKNDIYDDGGPAAEELRKIVKVAIDKYR